MKDGLGVQLVEGDVIIHSEKGHLYPGIAVVVKPTYLKYILIGAFFHRTIRTYYVKRSKNVIKVHIDESTMYTSPSGKVSTDITFGDAINEVLDAYGKSGQQVPSLRN